MSNHAAELPLEESLISTLEDAIRRSFFSMLKMTYGEKRAEQMVVAGTQEVQSAILRSSLRGRVATFKEAEELFNHMKVGPMLVETLDGQHWAIHPSPEGPIARSTSAPHERPIYARDLNLPFTILYGAGSTASALQERHDTHIRKAGYQDGLQTAQVDANRAKTQGVRTPTMSAPLVLTR